MEEGIFLLLNLDCTFMLFIVGLFCKDNETFSAYQERRNFTLPLIRV